jgi:hypothetical protein
MIMRIMRLKLALAMAVAVVCVALAQERSTARTFPTPEDAVRALIDAAKADGTDGLLGIFGAEGKELAASPDAEVTRRNREVFAAAAAERWALQEPSSDTRVLIVGNEGWPFPVPLKRDANGWRFDTEAGRAEVLSRRIGRNELAVIQICRTYVVAQRIYAKSGHDDHAPGAYATLFRSDPGKQNGLYWPVKRGQRRSPLGDLVANAAAEGRSIGGSAQSGAQNTSQSTAHSDAPAPFHGYYFKILTSQGRAAPGGAKSYVTDGRLSGGFALVAWPAQYGVTGIMTFVINQDDTLHERDLGPETATSAKGMTVYNPDDTWTIVPK